MSRSPVALSPLSLEPPKPFVIPKVKRNDVAAWIVGGKGFFDDKDQFWQPGSRLYFSGEPNIDLHPLNKLAFDRKEKFLDKLDEAGKAKAAKDGKEYVALPRTKWNPEEIIEELPLPDSVLGAPRQGYNEAIR